MKPPDQVQSLSEKDLAEEHTRVLKADNPQAPDNLARFNHKEKMYKFDPTVDQTAIALSLEGCALPPLRFPLPAVRCCVRDSPPRELRLEAAARSLQHLLLWRGERARRAVQGEACWLVLGMACLLPAAADAGEAQEGGLPVCVRTWHGDATEPNCSRCARTPRPRAGCCSTLSRMT